MLARIRATATVGACLAMASATVSRAAPAATPGNQPGVEEMPVIVTYELQRKRTADRMRSRDPQAFWIEQIMARVEDKRVDPHMKLPEPKTVKLMFTVARDGHVTSSTVAASSGVPALDKVAMDMVQQAQPFPPMPSTLQQPDLTFALPVRFR